MQHLLVILCAEYMVYVVVVGALAAFFKLRGSRRIEYTAVLLVSSLLALVLSLVAAKLHYEPRPFVTGHLKPIVPHGADNGFPSDHALFTMALTTCVFLYWRKLAYAMLLATALTGLGRVLGHLHSPQQILAGWLIALVSVAITYVATQKLPLPWRHK